jgi:hypothetical protein
VSLVAVVVTERIVVTGKVARMDPLVVVGSRVGPLVVEMLGTISLDLESGSGAARLENAPLPLCTHRRSARFGLEGLLEPQRLFLSRPRLRESNGHGICKHLVREVLPAGVKL